MKKYRLVNMDCAACAAKIENSVAEIEGVKFVNVNFFNSTMTIETDDFKKVVKKIKTVEPEVEIEDVKSPKAQRNYRSDLFRENRNTIIRIVTSLVLLLTGIIFQADLQGLPYRIGEYLIFIPAYLIVGWNVILSAIRNIVKGQVFNENFLMVIATLGAFVIDQKPEAVAVMLFYSVGELFQDIAVGRSRNLIKSLLEIKPEYANLKTEKDILRVDPEIVKIGDTIIVKPGEKVPLDGIVIEGNAFVDTSALTGESMPREVKEKDEVFAGTINQSGLLFIKVSKSFEQSSVARILDLVENATSQKAGTEKFITSFAKYYTPVVVIGAFLLAILPPLIFAGQAFSDWIYRALVVLVISCPCALVISIPLGYFGGIGRASRKGILVKGSNFLDALTRVKTVVFDKTGTLTKGEFRVSEVVNFNGFSTNEILEYAAYAESNSNHPLAKSISVAFENEKDNARIKNVKEISGYGIKAIVDDKTILAGNDKFLHKENIDHPVCEVEGTVVHIAINGIYAGYIIISDTLKEDSIEAVEKLTAKNINTVMLTGDNQYAATSFAKKLKIDKYFYELLPEDKVKHIEELISENSGGKVAFVGDGINDAPVIARADIGIAMGAFGSDAAIETADVVIMTDSPSKVSMAIDIAKITRNIVWQNIFFALSVKIVFIVLGIAGIATMWEAVFGDMGVALIAILNSVRILKT